MRIPNVLVMDAIHCGQLRLCGRAQVTEVRLGYISSTDHDLRKTDPQSADDRLAVKASAYKPNHAFKLWDRWVVGTARRPLEVRHADVLVTQGTLEDMLRYYHGITTPHPWASQKLRAALAAAQKHWGDAAVDPADKDTYPRPVRIHKWLTTEYSLSNTLADQIVELIRPEFAGKNRTKR